MRELWLKWEASNPTGSYKDRGMTVAVSKALEDGAEAVICASTGNTAASAAAYATRAGLPALVLTPQGAVSGAKLAQTRMLGATVLEVRGDFDEALSAAQELGRRGTHALVNSLNPNRRAGQKTAVFEIVEELGGPPDGFALPYGGGGNTSSYAQALAELGLATPLVSVEAVDRKATLATAIRIGDPVHASAVRTLRGARRRGHGRGARRRLAASRLLRGAVLRAVVRRGARRGPPRRRRGRPRRRDDHRPRPEGPRRRRQVRAGAHGRRARPRRDRRRRARGDAPGRAVTFRAPATSANLGPAFDCAAVALELWNELEVSEGDGVVVEGEGADELPADASNLAVRAYALLADPAGKRFRFTNRIPLERGLGSSAAAIALGLAAARPDGDPEELLAAGLELESHADNLAAALVGGVTLTWEGRIARIAEALPLAPVALVPRERTSTEASRRSLPSTVTHADAAANAGRAALLAAGAAAGSAELFAAGLDDRLHEPYRPSAALDAIRADLPAGARGATLSGSGPTVIVWADDPRACANVLTDRFPDHDVLELAVSRRGAL